MGKLDERDGIAILQLVVFPFILVAAVFIWSRTGWRVGSKIWRYAVTFSLLRIAGSISTLISIDHPSTGATKASNVCELIGIAPLLLTYIGLLRQMLVISIDYTGFYDKVLTFRVTISDVDEIIPPKPLKLVTVFAFIGLILGIAGVSTANVTFARVDGQWTYAFHPGALVQASMGIFIAVFIITVFITVWLFLQLHFSLKRFQKKLFLATALSSPFIAVRIVYSALGDYDSNDSRFAILNGNATIYLCMNVLEEIAAMVITMALGMAAVLERDFVKLTIPTQIPDGQTELK